MVCEGNNTNKERVMGNKRTLDDTERCLGHLV